MTFERRTIVPYRATVTTFVVEFRLANRPFVISRSRRLEAPRNPTKRTESLRAVCHHEQPLVFGGGSDKDFKETRLHADDVLQTAGQTLPALINCFKPLYDFHIEKLNCKHSKKNLCSVMPVFGL